jgi:hypothetical protein
VANINFISFTSLLSILICFIVFYFIITTINNKKVKQKLKNNNITEYKESKLVSFLWGGFFGGCAFLFIWFFSDSDIIMVVFFILIGFFRMLKGFVIPKIILSDEQLKCRENLFSPKEVTLKKVDQIKLKSGFIGRKEFEIINHNEEKKISKAVTVSNLRNMNEFIMELVRRFDKVEVDEKVKKIISENDK